MRREKALEFVAAAAAGQDPSRRQRNGFVGVVERALQQLDGRAILHCGEGEDEVDSLRRGELRVLRRNEIVDGRFSPPERARERVEDSRHPGPRYLSDRVQRRDDRIERGIERGILVVCEYVDKVV